MIQLLNVAVREKAKNGKNIQKPIWEEENMKKGSRFVTDLLSRYQTRSVRRNLIGELLNLLALNLYIYIYIY